MSPWRVPLRVATVAAVLLLTAACGDDPADTAEDPATPEPASSSSSSSSSSSGSALPACDEVWVAGAELPRGYRGCEQDGEPVEADKHQCSYGAAIVEFDDRFYAVTGKKINEVPSLAESQQFDRALTACQA